VFARMQELLKNPNALCFLCSACTYSYCGAGVQHGRNALNNKEYGWQGRDEDEFFCVTMATEWQRQKMVKVKGFFCWRYPHAQGWLFRLAPPSKPQFQSKAMHPPTNSETPIHYSYLNPPLCIRPFTDLQNFYTFRTPGLFDKDQVTIVELWIIIYWLWNTRQISKNTLNKRLQVPVIAVLVDWQDIQ